MRLITAHRILIRVFVVFSLLVAVVELGAWRRTGTTAALVTGVLSVAAAVGFGAYLRSLRRET